MHVEEMHSSNSIQPLDLERPELQMLRTASVKGGFSFWSSMNMIPVWEEMNGLQDLDVQPLCSVVEATSISERN